MTAALKQHRWNATAFFNDRGEHSKTERVCMNLNCTVIKVTQHRWSEPDPSRRHWIEFYDAIGGERMACASTPPCRGAAPVLKAKEVTA